MLDLSREAVGWSTFISAVAASVTGKSWRRSSRSGSHSSVRNIEAEGVLGPGVAAGLAFMEIFVAGSLDAVVGVRDQFSGRKLVAVFRLLHIRGRRLIAIHAGAAGWVVLPARRCLVRRCRGAKETCQDTCRQNQPCLRSAPIGRAARRCARPFPGGSARGCSVHRRSAVFAAAQVIPGLKILRRDTEIPGISPAEGATELGSQSYVPCARLRSFLHMGAAPARLDFPGMLDDHRVGEERHPDQGPEGRPAMGSIHLPRRTWASPCQIK